VEERVSDRFRQILMVSSTVWGTGMLSKIESGRRQELCLL